MLLEKLKQLPERQNDRFILSILNIPCGLFKTKEDLKVVVEYLDEINALDGKGNLLIWPVTEYESGQMFCDYMAIKDPNTIIN